MKNKRVLTTVCALVLAVGCAIGGTVAYLTDKTDAVVNTFTVGNVDIALKETKVNFKMIPGSTIDKDPKVSVDASSEDCWLFVKVEKSENLDNFIAYTIATGWNVLEGQTGVYYREAKASDSFSVLANDKVTTKNTVTKAMMDALAEEGATQPTLTFTAYAVQKEGLSVEQAWAAIPAADKA